MIDPRRESVLIKGRGGFEDRTADVAEHVRLDGDKIKIIFMSSRKPYPYGDDRVLVLKDPRSQQLSEDAWVEVDGCLWEHATEVVVFSAPGQAWSRVFYTVADGKERFQTYRASRVRLVEDAGRSSKGRECLRYLRSFAARLPADDPLGPVYRTLRSVHPESVLARYLASAPVEARATAALPIFPFRRNLSQWKAVEDALRHPVSVIEGPPGTGKTETILNIVATVVSAGIGTVGVISANNAAVDNVREKLDEAGLGYLVAALGNNARCEAFFAAQQGRNEAVERFMAAPATAEGTERLAVLDRQLRELYDLDRRRANLRHRLAAFRLEGEHFARRCHMMGASRGPEVVHEVSTT